MAEAYLDNCATTRVCDEAASAALSAMTLNYGNPSSLHRAGIVAEGILRGAREQLAQLLGCQAAEIYFTSGGTEANNLAVLGAAYALRRRGRRIVTTMVEHASVAEPMKKLEREGFEVVRLRPRPDGSIEEKDLFAAVTSDTILVSMMLVNNETGAILPVEAARRAVAEAGAPALVHCDAVQALGKLKVQPRRLGVDLLTVSGHKIHAPKGAGAIFIAQGARILPLAWGGGQEKGMRPGTEPVPAIAGFGEAARIIREDFARHAEHLAALRLRLLERLKSLDFVTVNSPAGGAPHIVNFSVPGIRSEVMLHYLEQREVYVSSGSACGRGERSPVLTAMGLKDELVDSAVRVSFSRYNTFEDIDRLVNGICDGWRDLAKTARRG